MVDTMIKIIFWSIISVIAVGSAVIWWNIAKAGLELLREALWGSKNDPKI